MILYCDVYEKIPPVLLIIPEIQQVIYTVINNVIEELDLQTELVKGQKAVAQILTNAVSRAIFGRALIIFLSHRSLET